MEPPKDISSYCYNKASMMPKTQRAPHSVLVLSELSLLSDKEIISSPVLLIKPSWLVENALFLWKNGRKTKAPFSPGRVWELLQSHQ